MVFCCAPGCKSRGGKLKRGSQTFHRFPTHPLLRKKWVEAVARVGWTPNNSRLCSLHFEDGDYDGSADLKRSRLKFGAVPSLFERARPDTVQVGEEYVRLDKRSKEANDFGNSAGAGDLSARAPSLLRTAPSRAKGVLDLKVYKEVTRGLEEEIEGRKEEVDEELDRIVREKRERKRRRRSKLRTISKLDEEYNNATKVELRDFDLSLENLHDLERSTEIRRKFHMLTKKVERLEAALNVSRRENERLRGRISVLDKNGLLTSSDPEFATGKATVMVVRSTQTRAQDFARVGDARPIEDSEDDAVEYRPPVQKRRRRNASPKKGRLQESSKTEGKTRETASTIVIPAASKEAKKNPVAPTSMPGYRAQGQPPSLTEADFGVEKHVDHLDSYQNAKRTSPPVLLNTSQSRLISIIKVEEQDATTYLVRPSASAAQQGGIQPTAQQATGDTVVIFSAAEGDEIQTNHEFLKIESLL